MSFTRHQIVRLNIVAHFALICFAQTTPVFLRPPAAGFCTVINATNTTPVRITVSAQAVDCGITTNGQLIGVTEIRGNTAANIHLESSSDSANLARMISNLSGDSFDLLDLAGNPVRSNGAYTNGGRVFLVQMYQLKPHPRLYLDGPGGPVTASVSDVGPLGRANATRPAFQALKAVTDQYTRSGYTWGDDASGELTLAAALRWQADGNEAARQAAKFGLVNISQVVGTLACAETERGCDANGSSRRDYPSQFLENFAQAYSIMRGELSIDERRQLIDFVFNDLPWTQGGFDYTDASWTKPAWKVRDPNTSGTVTYSGRTVTGTGTRFMTDARPGDIIVMGHTADDNYGRAYIVSSIESETSLTVNRPVVSPYLNRYMIGPPWSATSYGLLWHQKHYEAVTLCGGATALPDGRSIASCEENYKTNAGIIQEGTQNLTIARIFGWFAIGLALCGDDPRACLVLQLTNEYFVDAMLPRAFTIFTGFSQSSPGYHAWRMFNIVQGIAIMTKNSVVNGPDYLDQTDLHRKGAHYAAGAHLRYTLENDAGIFLTNGESGLYSLGHGNLHRVGMLSVFAEPQALEARQYKRWLVDRSGIYSDSFLRQNGGTYAWFYFLYDDPASIGAEPPTTFLFPSTNRARCVAIYGTAMCPPGEGRYMFLSHQNWSRERTFVSLNGASGKCLDHCTDELGGYIVIAKNGRALVAPDTRPLMGSRVHRGYIELGGTHATLRPHYPHTSPISVLWSAGNDEVMAANLDLTETYLPSVSATSVTRQVMHLKSGTQDYIIEASRVQVAAPLMIRGYQHSPLNGCGTPSSSSCVVLDPVAGTISNIQSNARLTSKVIGISGDMLIGTATGSLTNGTYEGGEGWTFRSMICPKLQTNACAQASTYMEWAVVHRPSLDPADALPPIVASRSGAFRVIEIRDERNPKVAVFTPQELLPGGKFRTGHVGHAQYLVAGLAEGTYQVLRDRSPLGLFAVKAREHTIHFRSLPGEFTIEAVPVRELLSVSPGERSGAGWFGLFSRAECMASPLSASGDSVGAQQWSQSGGPDRIAAPFEARSFALSPMDWDRGAEVGLSWPRPPGRPEGCYRGSPIVLHSGSCVRSSGQP